MDIIYVFSCSTVAFKDCNFFVAASQSKAYLAKRFFLLLFIWLFTKVAIYICEALGLDKQNITTLI